MLKSGAQTYKPFMVLVFYCFYNHFFLFTLFFSFFVLSLCNFGVFINIVVWCSVTLLVGCCYFVLFRLLHCVAGHSSMTLLVVPLCCWVVLLHVVGGSSMNINLRFEN